MAVADLVAEEFVAEARVGLAVGMGAVGMREAWAAATDWEADAAAVCLLYHRTTAQSKWHSAQYSSGSSPKTGQAGCHSESTMTELMKLQKGDTHTP